MVRDDSDLVQALKAGDQAAFKDLVESLHPTLVRTACIYVQPALADEVVQDTWVAVIRSIDTFEGRSSIRTWVFRIMLNRVRTLAMREGRVVPFASAGPRAGDTEPAVRPDRLVHPDLGPSYWPAAPSRWNEVPDQSLLTAELRQVIHTAIGALPPAQREVVALRDIEGWSADEVCAALGISSVNQRVLLHRGRARVRQAIEDYVDTSAPRRPGGADDG